MTKWSITDEDIGEHAGVFWIGFLGGIAFSLVCLILLNILLIWVK